METHHTFSMKTRKSSSKQETEWDHQLPSRFLCRTSFEMIIQSSDVQREEKVTRNQHSPLMSPNRENHGQNGQENEADSENDKTTSTQRSDQDSLTVSLLSLSSEISTENPKTFKRTSDFSEEATGIENKKATKNPNNSQPTEHSRNSLSRSRNGKASMGESGLFSNMFMDSKSNSYNKKKFNVSSSGNNSPKKHSKDFSPFRMNSNILNDTQENDLAGGDYIQSETENKNSVTNPENSQLNKLSGIFSISQKDINKPKAGPPTEESAYSGISLKNEIFLNKYLNVDIDFSNIHPPKLQHQIFIDKESKSSSKLGGGGNLGDFTLGPISDSHKDLKGIYRLSKPQVKSEQESNSSEGGGSLGFDTRTQEPTMKSAEGSSLDTDTGRESVETLNTYQSGEGSCKWKLSVTDLVEYFENLNSETDIREKSTKTELLVEMNFSCNESEGITENFLDCNKNKSKLQTEKRCLNNGKDSNNTTCNLMDYKGFSHAPICKTFNLRRRYFNNDTQSKSSNLLYHKDRKIGKCGPVDDHDPNKDDLMDSRKYGLHLSDKLKQSASVHSVSKVDLLHISKSEPNISLLESLSSKLEMEHTKESKAPHTAHNTPQCVTAATPGSVQLETSEDWEISEDQETTEDKDSWSSWLILALVYLLQYVILLLYQKN